MGDYPALPARVLETGETLGSVLEGKRGKELLGEKCEARFGAVLPFLPKVGVFCILCGRIFG